MKHHSALVALILLSGAVTLSAAIPWHHPLYLAQNGYWPLRVAVTLQNNSAEPLMGEPVAVSLPALAGTRLESFAPEEARESFRRCLELRPRHAAAHARLGRMLQEQGEFAAAAEHHGLAVDAEPSDAEHHFQLGLALEGLGRLSDAMRAWRDSVRLDPAAPV